MATTRRRTTKAASAAPARRGRPAAKASNAAAPRKAAPAPATKDGKDPSVYLEKPVSDYHKAFASWIVKEVGYDPNSANSLRAAFLKGVSLATSTRPLFMSSDYLEEWREKNGITKRGPKPAAEKAAPTNRRTRRAQPEPEVEEIDEEDEEFEEDESDEEDDEFDDEDSDEETDDDEFEDDEEDDEEDEVEEAPAPRRRGRPAKSAPVKATSRKAAPAKATRARAVKSDDDDFIF